MSTALAAYEELSDLRGALVEGLPAELVARQARLGVLVSQKRNDDAQQEAAALATALEAHAQRLSVLLGAITTVATHYWHQN